MSGFIIAAAREPAAKTSGNKGDKKAELGCRDKYFRTCRGAGGPYVSPLYYEAYVEFFLPINFPRHGGETEKVMVTGGAEKSPAGTSLRVRIPRSNENTRRRCRAAERDVDRTRNIAYRGAVSRY